MSKPRPSIPIQIKRMLIIESGNKCSMPHCSNDSSLEFHHIDEDPQNNKLENLLLLCSNHHSQVTRKKIDRQTCILIKNSLQSNLSEIPLNSRRDSVKKAIYYLKSNPNGSFRCFLVGPLFLNPDWVIEKRNSKRSIPNFQEELFNFIIKSKEVRNPDIRILFSLSDRYRDKIDEFVSIDEREYFIKNIIDNIYKLFGEDFEKGPDICCCHSGFSNINMIFDHSLITTYRNSQLNSTSNYSLSINKDSVNKAKEIFDSIFDSNSSGQKVELIKLINHIQNLWKK